MRSIAGGSATRLTSSIAIGVDSFESLDNFDKDVGVSVKQVIIFLQVEAQYYFWLSYAYQYLDFAETMYHHPSRVEGQSCEFPAIINVFVKYFVDMNDIETLLTKKMCRLFVEHPLSRINGQVMKYEAISMFW